MQLKLKQFVPRRDAGDGSPNTSEAVAAETLSGTAAEATIAPGTSVDTVNTNICKRNPASDRDKWYMRQK